MGYGYMLWKLLPGCGGKVSSGSGTGSCYDEKLCCCRGVACRWVAVLVIPRTTLRTAPITSMPSEEQRRRNIISGRHFMPPQHRSCTLGAGRYNGHRNYSTVLRIMTSFMLLVCSSYLQRQKGFDNSVTILYFISYDLLPI